MQAAENRKGPISVSAGYSKHLKLGERFLQEWFTEEEALSH